MGRFWLLLLLLPAWASEPTQTMTFGRGNAGLPIPALDQGYLVFTTHTSVGIEVWGPDGLLRFITSSEHPPAWGVLSVAVDSDGSVAAGIDFTSADGINGGIAYFDPTGKQTRFVDTGKYMPAHLCFGSDHELWTFGLLRGQGDDYEDHSDYMMFRKYSADGKEAGRYGPRSLLPGKDPPGGLYGAMTVRVARDRIGALAENRMWIELGLDGRLIGKWPLGKDLQGGLAFTSDARLCQQTPGNALPGISCFDRGTGKWKDAGEAPVPGMLLGAQGDELVFMRDEGVIRLYLARVP